MVEPKKEPVKKPEPVTSPAPVTPVTPVEPPQSAKMVDDAVNAAAEVNKAAERLEQANAVTAELQARQALGGGSEAGIQKEPEKVLTDTEYAEALQKGEVNPLAEDGFK